MRIQLNPVVVYILPEEETKDKIKPYELFIGETKNITSYLYQEDSKKLYIQFDGQWYNLHQPDIDAFLHIFHHLRKQSIADRMIRFMKRFESSGKRSVKRDSPRRFDSHSSFKPYKSN